MEKRVTELNLAASLHGVPKRYTVPYEHFFFDLADYLFESPIDFAQKLSYHIVSGKARDIIKSRTYKLNWRLALNLALFLRFGINLRFFLKKNAHRIT